MRRTFETSRHLSSIFIRASHLSSWLILDSHFTCTLLILDSFVTRTLLVLHSRYYFRVALALRASLSAHTSLILYSYFTPTLLMIYSCFTRTLPTACTIFAALRAPPELPPALISSHGYTSGQLSPVTPVVKPVVKHCKVVGPKLGIAETKLNRSVARN